MASFLDLVNGVQTLKKTIQSFTSLNGADRVISSNSNGYLDGSLLNQCSANGLKFSPTGCTLKQVGNRLYLYDPNGFLQGDLDIYNLYLTGALVKWGAGLAASVYNTADQQIPTGTGTALSFNSTRYDRGALFSLSSPTRLTPVTEGIYGIGCSVTFSANSTGSRTVNIRKNGNEIIALERVITASATLPVTIRITKDVQANANDYFEIIVQHSAGTNISVQSLGSYSPEFWIRRCSGIS